jgi:polysaccharide biosynthesis transport protein
MWKTAKRRYRNLDEEAPATRQSDFTGSSGLIDFRGLWLIVRRRMRLIATMVAAVLMVTAVALVVVPPRYSSTAVILVDPRQPRVTSSESVLSGIGSDAAAVESQVDLISSSALIARVVKRLDLTEDPEFNSVSLGQRLALVFGMDSADPEAQFNWILRRFQDRLDVRRRGLTYVLEITFTSAVPGKAARIANAVAETYQDDQRNAKFEATKKASAWLNDRIEELRTRVRDAESAVANYKADNNLIDTAAGTTLVQRQIEALNQQLILARASTAEARARLEQVEQITSRSGNTATLNEALQSPVIANLRSQYAEVARGEAELAAALGDHHPSLQRVRAQLADLRRQVDNEIARILTGVRNEFDVAKSREASLEADLARLKEQAARFDRADVRLRELQREAQANRTLFDQFLARSKETTEQQSLQIPDARIIAPALAPVRPTRPGTPLLLLVATAVSLTLGLGLALLLEHLDRSYRTIAEVEHGLSMTCLGLLPLAEAGRAGHAGSPARSLVRAVLDAPSSAFAEGLHSLRQRLRAAHRRDVGEVLAMVSAMPGEGKSTIAANLAHACAKAGVRTLLVDGDLRHGSLSAAYPSAAAGLVDVLQGALSIKAAVLQDARSGLSVLTGGARSDTVNALAEAEDARLAAVLDQMRQLFDLIIVDSPAILPIAESRRLLDCADRAVLVIEWRRTARDTVMEALNAIGEASDKIAGAILNKVNLRKYRLFDYGRYAVYTKEMKAARARTRPEAIAAAVPHSSREIIQAVRT